MVDKNMSVAPSVEQKKPYLLSDQVDMVGGWLKDFFGQFQLAWRLLFDKRVAVVSKIIPLLTLLYVVFPFDPIPDLVLGLGQLDDVAILLIGLRLFVSLCPADLVDEHKLALGGARDVWVPESGILLDLEAEVLDDEDVILLQEDAE